MPDLFPTNANPGIIGRGTSALLLGCGFLLDPTLLGAFNNGVLSAKTTLLTHFTCALCAMLPILRNLRRPDRDWQHAAANLQLGIWTTLLGPFGALIGMALLIPRTSHGVAGAQLAVTASVSGDGSAHSRHEALHHKLLDNRLRLDGGSTIRPLLETIIEGGRIEKLDALTIIARRYVPVLAPALRRALGDTDVSVRVLAATVMARLHAGHSKRIGALQEAVQAAPAPAAWRALGEARLNYAASGLLEADRADREAEEGRSCLKSGADPHTEEMRSDPSAQQDAATGVIQHAA